MALLDHSDKQGIDYQKSPSQGMNNNLANSEEVHSKRLFTGTLIDKQQLTTEQHPQSTTSSKRVLFFQFPFSQTISSNKRQTAFTFDPQASTTRKTLANGTAHFQFNTEQNLDHKISRILNSNYNQQTQMSGIKTGNFDCVGQNYQFCSSIIEKLDSAIYVIGGPNKVFEALNTRAQKFFQTVDQPIHDSNFFGTQNDIRNIFSQITLRNYNKSCVNYLESIGISKVDIPLQSTTQEKILKKGTLNSFFNPSISTYQFHRAGSPNQQPHQQQTSTKNSLKNQLTFKTPLTQTISHPSHENESKSLTKQETRKLKHSMSFPEVTLLDLIEKILEKSTKDLENEYIEIIEFSTTEELSDILKFVQIKINRFSSNGGDFLFVQFAKNQEREELMRQTIHKDIEYSTFKTISHELGTYINFMLLILDGAKLDKSIPQECKDDYFFNLQNNAQFLNCIIQDIRDYQSHLNHNLRVQIKSTPIRTLVVNTCTLFTQMIKMKEIEFEVQIDDDVPSTIFTDKLKIQQILIHLIQNALKFSLQKTSIIVSVSMSEQESGKQKIICFSVQDMGIGMDEEEQERLRTLLDNIYLSDKVSKHSSGFGFGLTISNILATKLHSTHKTHHDNYFNFEEEFGPGIHFTSEKNNGSQFKFYINVSDSENIVALSISNEKVEKLMYKSLKVQNIKFNEYEYLEHEDDIEMSKRELFAENNLDIKLIEHSEMHLSIIGGKSLHRPLSKKMTLTQEKGNLVSKLTTEKSKFGFAATDTIAFGKTNTLLPDTVVYQNKLNFERKGPKRVTQSILINQFVWRKSDTLNLNDDVDEEIQVHQIPIFKKTLGSSKCQQMILIVDDEMMNIFGLKMMFRILGIDPGLILQANNGEEALDHFSHYLNSGEKQVIKLVIMDINMPVMDGIEATISMLEMFQAAKLQNFDLEEPNIVACSSYDDYDIKLQCLNAGMISYLSKPCNKDSLSHIIEKYYYK